MDEGWIPYSIVICRPKSLLSPRVSDGPRCCYMDGHVILNTQGFLIQWLHLQKASGQGVRTHPPMVLLAMVYISSFRGTVPLINGEEIFSVVMMTIGVVGCGPWLLVVIAYYPDVYALPASFALPWIGEDETSFAFPEAILLWLCGKKWLQKRLFRLSGVSEASEKAIDKLNAKEFRERFLIPHDVLIDLVNEEAAMPTEKGGKNAILFTKEQFKRGLRFPLPALFKEFLHFSQIPPILFTPTLSGC
ncbi:hypothetical protein CK203_096609 [Vitis vinifera]|uniref:Uncharacterized protein n=1 Tax=Vitis vinifera TaxID=29760 RepID=A0A438BR83_VITVI|nr:hypothetical protein CK203_096609 [Vitis vinifera]